MPALGLFLLDCRDRANCMDGLIETVFFAAEPLDTGVCGRWPGRWGRPEVGFAT